MPEQPLILKVEGCPGILGTLYITTRETKIKVDYTLGLPYLQKAANNDKLNIRLYEVLHRPSGKSAIAMGFFGITGFSEIIAKGKVF